MAPSFLGQEQVRDGTLVAIACGVGDLFDFPIFFVPTCSTIGIQRSLIVGVRLRYAWKT